MTVLSSKPKYPLYDKTQAFLNKTSPILLQNSTIKHLQELSLDMPVRSRGKHTEHITYDDLIVELIKVYRKKKGLWDPIQM